MRFVVTGGAGFVGSHIVDFLLQTYPDVEVVILDKITYAASKNNLAVALTEFSHKCSLVVLDLTDFKSVKEVLKTGDFIIHAAAESHVDNSFSSSLVFSKTNCLGTHNLLQASMENGIEAFLHISTDEVYGENTTDKPFYETQKLNPSNPYSASKAAAEMILIAYQKFCGFKTFIIRSNNIFGPRQYPEKLIPRSIMRLKEGMELELHGDGENRRSYLHVKDFAEAIGLVIEKGSDRGVYNVGSKFEMSNFEVACTLVKHVNRNVNDAIVFVKDRPFNDHRYWIATDKIAQLGWTQRRSFEGEIEEIVNWYLKVDMAYWCSSGD